MHMIRASLYWTLAMVAAAAHGQVPAGTAQGQAPAQNAAAAPVAPSALLQPALDNVQAALNGLKLDKWKKGSVRDEAGGNVASILHDVQTNLPPLLTEATPGVVSKSIPLLKHLDAVYDVLLRVEEAARVSAPVDQIDALQQALLKLSSARLALDEQLQMEAEAQEKQAVELQIAIKTQQAAQSAHSETASAKTEPCKPATRVRKKRKATPPSKPTPANAPSGKSTPQAQPKQ